MSSPQLGPACGATIIVSNLDDSTAAYHQHLDLKPCKETRFTAEQAQQTHWSDLAGQRSVWLANALGEPWLRLIESPHSAVSQAFTHYGWMSLEIVVEDVDALGERLRNSPFTIIGPPENLAMSDAIRAMQLIGPAGEVLYLTQIKDDVPGFELPRARCPVDRLFIPVMMCPNRDQALAHYSQRSGNKGLRFETRISILNEAFGHSPEYEHALATLQLRENTLIEIDQVEGLAAAPFDQPLPPTGIALVHFAHDGSDSVIESGAAGERYLLVNN